MGPRTERLKRALFVGRVARRGGLLRVLRELGVWGNRPATREGAQEFRRSLEELGTTYIKLGQLLSSRRARNDRSCYRRVRSPTSSRFTCAPSSISSRRQTTPSSSRGCSRDTTSSSFRRSSALL